MKFLKLGPVFLLVFAGFPATEAAQIPTAERIALLALYNSTLGPGWDTNTNWGGAEGTECSWFGVTCNGDGTAVIELTLESNNLTGSITPALGNLSSLEVLNLRTNQLVGTIPEELGNLSMLRILYLHDNGLNGPIPPELGGLGALVELRLYRNNLTGPIPAELGDLAVLEILDLRENQLTSIPPELGNLTALTHLHLNDNQLSGPVPPELEGLTSLVYLGLSSNLLDGTIPPELGNLDSATSIQLSGNQLTGSIPAALGNLESLQALSLYENQLSGSIPPEIGNLSALKTLSLHHNQLTGSIPPELGNLWFLDTLHLGFNQLNGTIPPKIGSLYLLRWLYLSDNQLSGSLPPEIGNLSSLIWLDLRSNELSGEIPIELGNLTRVSRMYLSGNKFSGEIPDAVTNLSYLYDDASEFRWNGLYTENPAVESFLNQKQEGGDWQSTQTVAPENVTVGSVGDHTIWMSWDAVRYLNDPGGYEIFYSQSGLDQWSSAGWTDSKTETEFPVTGLDPGTSYDLAVVSFTEPHTKNKNVVISEASPEEMATTGAVGCTQPEIEITWGDSIILTAVGDFTSHLWSTGATSSSITVAPETVKWYWVTVTSDGSCEETAAISIAPGNPIFSDGFESGGTESWSTTVPGP